MTWQKFLGKDLAKDFQLIVVNTVGDIWQSRQAKTNSAVKLVQADVEEASSFRIGRIWQTSRIRSSRQSYN
jgi:hypothetical protein